MERVTVTVEITRDSRETVLDRRDEIVEKLTEIGCRWVMSVDGDAKLIDQ